MYCTNLLTETEKHTAFQASVTPVSVTHLTLSTNSVKAIGSIKGAPLRTQHLVRV